MAISWYPLPDGPIIAIISPVSESVILVLSLSTANPTSHRYTVCIGNDGRWLGSFANMAIRHAHIPPGEFRNCRVAQMALQAGLTFNV